MNQENATTQSRKMMGPLTALKTCFKKYADFKGRANKAEYWWFWLFYYVWSTIGDFNQYWVLVCWWLVVAVPLLAVGARRLHDINRSGWWQIFSIVPLITSGLFMNAYISLFISGVISDVHGYLLGAIVVGGLAPLLLLLVWLCRKGDEQANRFGDPV